MAVSTTCTCLHRENAYGLTHLPAMSAWQTNMQLAPPQEPTSKGKISTSVTKYIYIFLTWITSSSLNSQVNSFYMTVCLVIDYVSCIVQNKYFGREPGRNLPLAECSETPNKIWLLVVFKRLSVASRWRLLTTHYIANDITKGKTLHILAGISTL